VHHASSTHSCFDDCISASCTEGQRITSPNVEDYDAYSDALDCHRYSASGWMTKQQINSRGRQERLRAWASAEALSQSRIWSTDEFSSSPWVAFKVASEIGTEYEGPFGEVIRMIESQWEQIIGIGHSPHQLTVVKASLLYAWK